MPYRVLDMAAIQKYKMNELASAVERRHQNRRCNANGLAKTMIQAGNDIPADAI
jgi:hypothetical protein